MNRSRPVPALLEVIRDRHGYPTWLVYTDGTMLRPIAGGSEPAPEPTPSATPPAGVPQDQLNAIVNRTKTTTEQETTAALLKRLGYATVEEAETAAKAAKDAADALKSQQQRDADAAAEAKRAADADKAEAARERHDAKVERALAKAGLDLDNGTLLRAGLAAIDLQPGADADTIKAAVEKLKTDAPQLFATSSNGGAGGGTHTDPGNPRRTADAPTGEFGGRGKAEAERRFAEQRQKQTA